MASGKGTGVASAAVHITNELTGFRTATLTSEKCDYLFKELPLGGPYVVHSNSIGFTEQTQTGFMLNQGDLVKVDFTLIDTAVLAKFATHFSCIIIIVQTLTSVE